MPVGNHDPSRNIGDLMILISWNFGKDGIGGRGGEGGPEIACERRVEDLPVIELRHGSVELQVQSRSS